MGSKSSNIKIPFSGKLPEEYEDKSYSRLKDKINKYSYKIDKNSLPIFKEKIKNNDFNEEFKLLKNEVDFQNLKNNRRVEKSDKDRYGDILPFKDNLVPLNEVKYINASFINIPEKHNFIATQAPLENTVSDFWEMIYEYNVNVIVMLCDIKEGNKIKCCEYWNKKLMEKDNKFNLVNISEIKTNYKDLMLKKIEFQKNGHYNVREVYHLNYIGWPDHNIPDLKQFYDTLVEMFDFINKEKSDTTVIHCSAGVGRTGSFLTMINLYNNILEQMKKGNTYFGISFFGLVRQLKEMRMLSVENDKQYTFIAKFIYEIFKRIFKD